MIVHCEKGTKKIMNDVEREKLKNIIEESNNIVFFGGAGVSTESGVPDFRSKTGLYNQHDVEFARYEPEYLLSKRCLYNNPKVFYEFYRQKLDARDIEPSITHEVLADMEKTGKLSAIVTQNIDGLHQKAGSKNVFEIHGSTSRNYCVKCGAEYPVDYIFESDGIPICPKCNRPVRPDVVLYGEKLPMDTLYKATTAISKADCLIVGGTSLQVWPAAGIVSYFKGDYMVVINKDHLPIELGDGDLQINDSLGNVFREIKKYI